jgi:hypothetical protein
MSLTDSMYESRLLENIEIVAEYEKIKAEVGEKVVIEGHITRLWEDTEDGEEVYTAGVAALTNVFNKMDESGRGCQRVRVTVELLEPELWSLK